MCIRDSMMIALTPRIPICRTAQYFNPHFRKGSDRAAAIYRMPGKYFNPHFRKGSDWFSDSRSAAHHYFNPHFRKGSDSYSHPHADFTNISIHTSAREVTEVFLSKMIITKFQSTLPQGKWRRYTASARLPHDFNPHFRKGSDFCPTGIEVSYPTISIHTSAREVTDFWFSVSDC